MARVTFKRDEGDITLINGDCITYLPDIQSGTVALCTSSPPYNIGLKYASHDDTVPRAEYLDWCGDWIGDVRRALKDDGSFFLNMGSKPSDPWGAMEVAFKAREQRFVLQNNLVWVKHITLDRAEGPVAAGHFKPINSKRFVNTCWKHLFHFTKTGEVELDRLAVGVEYADKTNVARFGAEGRPDKRCRGDTWFCPYDTVGAGGKAHPAAFPECLVEMTYLLAGVKPGALTLDPFSGSGTSAVVAAKMGLAHIGMEVDPGYWEASVLRVAETLGGLGRPFEAVLDERW